MYVLYINIRPCVCVPFATEQGCTAQCAVRTSALASFDAAQAPGDEVDEPLPLLRAQGGPTLELIRFEGARGSEQLHHVRRRDGLEGRRRADERQTWPGEACVAPVRNRVLTPC